MNTEEVNRRLRKQYATQDAEVKSDPHKLILVTTRFGEKVHVAYEGGSSTMCGARTPRLEVKASDVTVEMCCRSCMGNPEKALARRQEAEKQECPRCGRELHPKGECDYCDEDPEWS